MIHHKIFHPLVDAIALYVESLASNYETKSVPAPMDAFAQGKQVPYQPAQAASSAAAIPAAAPVAAVPASNAQPQKPTTQENPADKVEGMSSHFIVVVLSRFLVQRRTLLIKT